MNAQKDRSSLLCGKDKGEKGILSLLFCWIYSSHQLYCLLFECADVYDFSVGKSYFSGYDSFFIDGINGITNGDDDRYWQYYVNGEFANVGCSQYILHNGDLVEWRFEVPDWLV